MAKWAQHRCGNTNRRLFCGVLLSRTTELLAASEIHLQSGLGDLKFGRFGGFFWVFGGKSSKIGGIFDTRWG